MRAGPLSTPKIINLLNTHFVNVWVLLRDVPELQAGAEGSNAAILATKLRQHYSDSVDILTLTPDLEVIEHLSSWNLFHPYYLPRSEADTSICRAAKVICGYGSRDTKTE